MILALRALGVGDLATAVPALRGLRAAFGGERLVLAAPSWLAPLAGLIGGIDEVLPVSGLDSTCPLPAAGVAVNLHGRGPQSHRLLGAAGGKLWAYANREIDFLDGPVWDENEHEVARWCRLVRHYGVEADERDLRLAMPDAEVPRGVTIIHPGAKSTARRWPPDRFAAVARKLAAQGHHLLVTGSDAENELAVRVATAAGLPATAAPRTSLLELAALIARARLLISGDTGVAHLATAFGTPSVTLFGPMPPARWGPPPSPLHRTIWHGTRAEPGDLPGPPHPALLAVTADQVLASIPAL